MPEGFVLFHLLERIKLVATAVAYIASGTGPFATEDYLFLSVVVGKSEQIQACNEVFIDCVGFLIFRILIGVLCAFFERSFHFEFDNTLIVLFQINLWQQPRVQDAIQLVDLLSLFLPEGIANVRNVTAGLVDVSTVSYHFVLGSHRQLGPHVQLGQISQPEGGLFDFLDDFAVLVDVLVFFDKVPFPLPGVFRDGFLHFGQWQEIGPELFDCEQRGENCHRRQVGGFVDFAFWLMWAFDHSGSDCWNRDYWAHWRRSVRGWGFQLSVQMAAKVLAHICIDAVVEVFIVCADNVVFAPAGDHKIGLRRSAGVVQCRANGF